VNGRRVSQVALLPDPDIICLPVVTHAIQAALWSQRPYYRHGKAADKQFLPFGRTHAGFHLYAAKYLL